MDTSSDDWWRRSDDLDEMIDDLTVKVIERKEHEVRNGPADIDPAVFYMPREVRYRPSMSHLVVMAPEDCWQEGIAMAMGIAVTKVRGECGEPLMCGFVAEAWVRNDGEVVGGDRDSSTRGEAILIGIYYRAPTGRIMRRARMLKFRYADGGVVFDPVDDNEPDDYTDQGDNPFVRAFMIGEN